MPVEFECPHCEVTLQAPKQMMGMVIACGQCQKQLGVPRIAVPVSLSSQEIPVYQPTVPPTPAVESPKAGTTESGLSFLEQSIPTTPVGSISRRRKRRRSSGSFPLVPVLFIGLAVTLGGIGYWSMLPSYQFSVEATRLPALDEHRVIMPPASLTADQRQALTSALTGGKLEINSSLLNASVSLVAGNLNLAVQAGDQTNLVRVNLLENTDFKNYVIEHASSWDKQRQQKFQKGLALMVEAAKSDSLQSDPTVLAKVRDLMILAGLSGGLSDSLQATIGNTIYPCVGQDSENGCYFVIPLDSRSFVIRERDDINDRLPSGFEVTVYQINSGTATITDATAPDSGIPVVETPESEEPEMQTPENGSMQQSTTLEPASGDTMSPGMMKP